MGNKMLGGSRGGIYEDVIREEVRIERGESDQQ